jgi:hypothetical protein
MFASPVTPNRRLGLLAFAVAFVFSLVSPTATGAQQQACPNLCASSLIETHSGDLPQNVIYQAVPISTSDGDGDDECATCDPCIVVLTFSYNDNGTGDCITTDHGGSGWIIPRTSYARTGKLSSGCDNEPKDELSMEIGDCMLLPNLYDYTEKFTLECGCVK